MQQEIARLKETIDSSSRIVFFGGAGVSTASGIPDFRGPDGAFNRPDKYPPEYRLSRRFFDDHTEEFYHNYKTRMLATEAKPNAAHIYLTKLEEQGKLLAVITQNIDGLHQKAGTKNVYELHGSVYRNYCQKCGRFYDVEYVQNSEGIPLCEDDGGIVKPDVVLYEEQLNHDTIKGATNAVSQADMLLVGGTSLAVYPAAGYVSLYQGDKLAIVNMSPTPYDNQANLVVTGDIAKIFESLMQADS